MKVKPMNVIFARDTDAAYLEADKMIMRQVRQKPDSLGLVNNVIIKAEMAMAHLLGYAL